MVALRSNGVEVRFVEIPVAAWKLGDQAHCLQEDVVLGIEVDLVLLCTFLLASSIQLGCRGSIGVLATMSFSVPGEVPAPPVAIVLAGTWKLGTGAHCPLQARSKGEGWNHEGVRYQCYCR